MSFSITVSVSAMDTPNASYSSFPGTANSKDCHIKLLQVTRYIQLGKTKL